MIGRGSKEDIRTRYLEGYVEKDGLDFIVWISLGKCVSLVLLYTEQFVLFYVHCSTQILNICTFTHIRSFCRETTSSVSSLLLLCIYCF